MRALRRPRPLRETEARNFARSAESGRSSKLSRFHLLKRSAVQTDRRGRVRNQPIGIRSLRFRRRLDDIPKLPGASVLLQ